jgi:ribonuclease PH
MFFRSDNRSPDQLRPVVHHSRLYLHGRRLGADRGRQHPRHLHRVDRRNRPAFMRNSGKGWISSEYSMLPRATLTRTPREVTKGRASGRTHEIQRLIGRSCAPSPTSRASASAPSGSTATSSRPTAARAPLPSPAHSSPSAWLWKSWWTPGTLTSVPLKDFVAAVSVGIVDGEILLDLCYEEDSRADVDMNFVMTAGHKLVEVQATAEHQVFDDQQLAKMIAFAKQGVQSLIAKAAGRAESADAKKVA